MKFMNPKGLTHGGTLQSGRTNLKRQTIKSQKEKEVTLHYPSGDSSLFLQGYDADDEPIFQVKEILKVNGSKFEHLAKGKGEFSFVCKNRKTGKRYSQVDTKGSMENNDIHKHYETSDGRNIDHFYMHHSFKVTSDLQRPNGVMK